MGFVGFVESLENCITKRIHKTNLLKTGSQNKSTKQIFWKLCHETNPQIKSFENWQIETKQIHGFAKRIHVFTNLLYDSRILNCFALKCCLLNIFLLRNLLLLEKKKIFDLELKMFFLHIVIYFPSCTKVILKLRLENPLFEDFEKLILSIMTEILIVFVLSSYCLLNYQNCEFCCSGELKLVFLSAGFQFFGWLQTYYFVFLFITWSIGIFQPTFHFMINSYNMLSFAIEFWDLNCWKEKKCFLIT